MPRPNRTAWPVEVRTRRLILRPPTEDDYDAVREGKRGRSAPINRYDAGPVNTSRRDFESLVASLRQWAKKREGYVLFAFHRRTGAYLGYVDISTIGRERCNWANLGYAINNQHHGRGYATEAVRAALRIAFTQLHFHRVEAACAPDNRPSQALARKVGMMREGVRREFWLEDEGGWGDRVIYVALAPRSTREIEARAR